MSCSRRALLWAGGAMAGMSLGPWPGLARSVAAAQSEDSAARSVSLLNLHTSERLRIEYFRDGTYVPEALAAIATVLRDFRTGERHAIDPHLMDYLVEVARAAAIGAAFSVISAYRSPITNERLRAQSSEVAQHSLHMQGRAIDVRVPGIDCADLAAHARALKRGGVGYYRASDFVHLDTGAYRTWKG